MEDKRGVIQYVKLNSSIILKKLKKGKKYFVQVRAYQKVNGTMCYGNWSKKKVKIR